MTLKEVIKNFMCGQRDATATLKEIYGAIDNSNYVSESNTVHASARAVIYRDDAFKRICKGVYMLKGQKSTSLLINGDGRKFAEYDVFRYEKADFEAKARVLKEGAYLVEFLPVESATNWEYLHEVKLLAKKCGLNYYTHCIWRNAPEGRINTGKTTKGVQQLVIFSKGKPRKLSRPGVAGYQTREILNYEIEILLNQKDKTHQAEKPVALYEYLIKNLTEEDEICLDQFGGSCNMAKAAVNTNRFSIVYELAKDFCVKAAERFGMTKLYDGESNISTFDPFKAVEESILATRETKCGQFTLFA